MLIFLGLFVFLKVIPTFQAQTETSAIKSNQDIDQNHIFVTTQTGKNSYLFFPNRLLSIQDQTKTSAITIEQNIDQHHNK